MGARKGAHHPEAAAGSDPDRGYTAKDPISIS